MYETFFGFRKRPFLSSPTLDRYFPSEEIERAFRTVAHSIERADGPVAIMGNSGTGKSLLGLRIADSWRKNFEVILLSSSKFCTRRALLQCLLFELRMPYRDLSEGELRLSLQERLQLSMENPSDGLILIVDEAQSLNLKLLEELRMLTNLARDGQPRVRLILIGTPRLDELLGHSRMESLNQRLAARCYLHSLPYEEARRYLQHKVELGGVDCSTVFTEDAIRAIHRAADGVPRLLDQIADHALRHAASIGQRPIAASLVEQAWANLQQLPSPWMDALPIDAPNAIEFGPLDLDEDSDSIEFESLEASAEHELNFETPVQFSERYEEQENEPVVIEAIGESKDDVHWLPSFEPTTCSTPPNVDESNMLDEIFHGSSAFISTNCYDLDEAVTIGDFVEAAQPHSKKSFWHQRPRLGRKFRQANPRLCELPIRLVMILKKRFPSPCRGRHSPSSPWKRSKSIDCNRSAPSRIRWPFRSKKSKISYISTNVQSRTRFER